MTSTTTINQSDALTNKLSNKYRNHRASTVSKKAFNVPSTAIFTSSNSLSEHSQDSILNLQNQVSTNFVES